LILRHNHLPLYNRLRPVYPPLNDFNVVAVVVVERMSGEKRLSALAVRNAVPGIHADGGSLFLHVSEDGRRKWTWRYRSSQRVRDLAGC
jgi:hypothetical protein